MKFNYINLDSILIAFILFVLLFTNIPTHSVSDNDASRLAGIVSVIQNNTLSIDQTPFNRVGDRIVYENVSYSSKPPLLHVMTGLIVKSIFEIKPVLANNNVAIYRVSTALTNTLPIILIYFFFYILLDKTLKIKSLHAHLFSAFLIFGTLLLTYSRYLTNHILEALLQLLLLFILVKFQSTKLYFTLVGVLLSALFAIDITNGVIVVPATILWLIYYKKTEFKGLVWIFLGSFPILFTHFYLSYIQFGTILPPQLFPETYLSYAGSKWIGDVQGFEALNHSIPIRFFNYTFGTHGLFLYQPLLLIPFFIRKNWSNPFWLYVFVIALGYILFNTIMQKNYAGSAFGPRRLLPLIPVIYFFVVQNILEYWNQFNLVKKSLIVLAFVTTILISYIGYTNPWNNYEITMNSKKVYFPILYTLQSDKK